LAQQLPAHRAAPETRAAVFRDPSISTTVNSHLLASLSLPGHDPHSYCMWNGIYRSLRIRGLVDRNLRLTDDGRAALAQCKFFSPLFTASLTNQSTWHEGVAPRHHRHGRRPSA